MRSFLRIPAVLLLLIFTTLPVTTHAFANYLLSNIGCMTDLSTDEVIMNSNVVAASDSDRPDVRLQLVSTDKARTEALGDGSTRVYLSTATASLPLQLVSEDPINDVQFVVETTEGAQMENGQCDNAKRVAARGKDTVTLQLLELDKSSPIFVWAGWATGHEAVRLTPALEFHYESGEPKKSSNTDTDAASQDEKEEVKKKLEEQLNEYQEETDKIVKKKEKDNRHHPDEDHRREHDHHHHRFSSGSKSGDKKKGEASSRLRKSETSRRARKSEDPNHHHNNHHQKSFTQKIKEHIAKHKKKKDSAKTEPGIQLDMTWFVLGLGILLVGNFVVVQCCTFAAGKAGDSTKGRPHTL